MKRTTEALGYPCIPLLRRWILEKYPDTLKENCSISGQPLPNLSQSIKDQAVKELCFRKCFAKDIAKKYGIALTTLYQWAWDKFGKGNLPMVKKYKSKKVTSVVIENPVVGTPQDIQALEEKREDLLKQINELEEKTKSLTDNYEWVKMELDAMNKAVELLKKLRASILKNLKTAKKSI